jgi:hypothetical protein
MAAASASALPPPRGDPAPLLAAILRRRTAVMLAAVDVAYSRQTAQKEDELAPVLNYLIRFAGGAAVIAFVNLAPIAGNKPTPMDLRGWFATSTGVVLTGAVLIIVLWYLSHRKPPGSTRRQ